MRKLLLTVALGVAACVVAPAAAQAGGPVLWLSNGVPIPAGTVEPVATSGSLTFTLRAATGAPLGTIKCKVADLENIQNGPNGGIDEMIRFSLSGCKVKGKPSPCPPATTPEVNALGTPWRSALTPGPPIRDEFTGVALEVACSGAPVAVYTGTLTPEVGSGVLLFGAGSGVLTGGGGALETSGKDKLKGPKGDMKITAS